MSNQLIEIIKQQMVAQYGNAITTAPNARERIELTRDRYKEVGMYSVVMHDVARGLGAIAALVEPYLKDDAELAVVGGVLRDMQQKALYAAETRMKYVPREAFDKLLATFQQPVSDSAGTVFVIDQLYMKNQRALIEYLEAGGVPPATSGALIAKMPVEKLDEVFDAFIAMTKGVIFPACSIKKLSMVLPEGESVYTSFMSGLPLMMDQVFASVLDDVEKK